MDPSVSRPQGAQFDVVGLGESTVSLSRDTGTTRRPAVLAFESSLGGS